MAGRGVAPIPALRVKKGVVSSGTSSGNVAYTGVGFTPKAIMLWASRVPDNDADNNYRSICSWSGGFGTRRGGATQQAFVHGLSDIGTPGTVSARGISNDRILVVGASASSTLIDSIATLTSFDADGFTLNWIDASTFAFDIHYLALGGDAITDASVGTTYVSASPTGQTVASGFGKPDLLLNFFSDASGAIAMERGKFSTGFGAAVDDGTRRASQFWINDAGTHLAASWQKAAFGTSLTATPAAETTYELTAKTSWPTDGFQVSRSSAVTKGFAWLALRGTFSVAMGAATAPGSAGSTSLTGGTSPARLALCWGNNQAASSAMRATTATDMGAWWLGASDGVNHGGAGHTFKSNWGFNAAGGVYHNDDYVEQMWQPPAAGNTDPIPRVGAVPAFNGNNVDLTWTGTDTSSTRSFNYLILGSD